jgi:hypothetical protein
MPTNRRCSADEKVFWTCWKDLRGSRQTSSSCILHRRPPRAFVAVLLVHFAYVISRQINAVRNILGTRERSNVVEMAGIAETYYVTQFERVHPDHGSAEVVAQSRAFALNATVQGTRRHVQIFVDSNKNTSRSRGNSRFLPGTHRRTSEWPELCVTARHVVRSAASSDAGIKLR